MRIRFFKILILFLTLFYNSVFCQKEFIEDSIKIIPFLIRGESIYSYKLDSAFILWSKGLELTRLSERNHPASATRMKKIEAVFLNDLGYYELTKGNNEIAMRYFDSCMTIQYELELWDQYALALNNKANIFLQTGKYNEAIEVFLESINFYRTVNKLK